jgi:serine/threonine protein kinase/Tfp pilus assembly protein PilF
MNASRSRLDLKGLDPARLDRLGRILDEVLDLPPEEVPGALDRLCAGETLLRSQAEALVAADTEAGRFLEEPAIGTVPGLGRLKDGGEGLLPDTSLLGARLGPYRVLREIARGGMGRVFLAERADGAFEQTVAVKLVKRGLDTDAIIGRFLRERQILARLAHPNIARLLDGGVTGDGLPWFALEFVEGMPITEHCDRKRESLRSVLRLFAQAGRAVQFAHRALVVHRDLKPSNILVSAGGEVKLLDFGIAKLLEPGPEEGEATEESLRPMTPIYAAPEQVRGEPPTTATDVYALGVVLYELLTGVRAYRRPTGTPEEIRAAILEEVPELPSARLRRAAPATHRAGWPPALRGDLDNIVLQALRKEPERRYASAEALVDDIERHLAGRPVRASGRRFIYVARKFARRNRVAVGAALLVLASLTAGLFVTTRERDRARLEARRAQELKDFALDLFSVSDPLSGERADQITARELLDRGARRVETELRGQPAVQAEMWGLLGSVYRNLGLFPQAVEMHERALQTYRAAGAADSVIASTLTELGQSLNEKGEYPAAERALREAIAIRKRRFGLVSVPTAGSMSALATVLSRQGHAAPAESIYRLVIPIDSVTAGMRSATTASDLSNLGMAILYDGRYAEALPYLRSALAARETVRGPDHPEIATDLDNMASCLEDLGDLDSALVLRQKALRIRERWFAPDHPDIAFSLSNLGELYRDMGRYPAAEGAFRRALAIRGLGGNPEDPYIAQDHNGLAVAFFFHGLVDSAEAHFRAALRIWGRTLTPNHRSILTARNNLAVILRDRGRYQEAERIFRDVLARRIRSNGPSHPSVAYSEYNLARLLAVTRRQKEAEALFLDAIGIREASLGADHPKVAEVQGWLAGLYRDEGRYRESAALYDSALATCRTKFTEPNPATADILVGKGRLLTLAGRPGEAESLLRESLRIRRGALEPGDPRIAESEAALGVNLTALGRSAEARPLLARAIPVLSRQPGTPDPLVARARAAQARPAGAGEPAHP